MAKNNIVFCDHGPAVTEQDIADYEKFINAKLPPEYREVLLKYNCGYIDSEPSYDDGLVVKIEWKKRREDNNYAMLGYMLRLKAKVKSTPDLRQSYKDLKEYIPMGFIPFMRDPGSSLFLIGVSDNNYGQIYFLRHQEELGFIANSFPEFLEKLEPYQAKS